VKPAWKVGWKRPGIVSIKRRDSKPVRVNHGAKRPRGGRK
jgi:hypothetical protein